MMSLIERLRAETRPEHEQTEQLLYTDALRTGTLSIDQYSHLLRLHGTFHDSLERTIDQHPQFFSAYEPDSRRKMAWLLADLAQTQSHLPTLPNPLADWPTAELLGAAYVGEGSMLGGKTVWQYLNQSPALQPLLSQARFYRGYGAETGARWRSFVAFVTQLQPSVNADAVIAGARQAFNLYRALFDTTQSPTGLTATYPTT